MRWAIAAALLVATGSARADDDAAASAPGHYTQGWFASAGFAYVPAGIDGPGDATAELFQGGVAMRWQNVEARFSGLLALESTYYQSSVNMIALGHLNRYLGDMFSAGVGVGLGIGSTSPKPGMNAADGTTPEIVFTATPVTLHLGSGGHVEVGLEIGTVYLMSFSENDLFYQLSVGYARW